MKYKRDWGRLGLSCSEWKEVCIGNIINFNPRENIPINQIAKKIPMETLAPFSKYISSYTLTNFNGGTKFRNGDTLFARITPCLENGKTSQVTILDEDEIGFGSTEYLVLRAIPQITDKDFIYYLFVTPYIRNIAIKSMVGSSGRQRVQLDVLKSIYIFLPPISEQKEIAATLSCIDDKIELNNRINKNLEEMAQAIFKRWFVDFEFPDENGNPYKSSGGEMVESELGRIPKRWEVVKIGDMHIKISDFVANGSFALLKQNVNVYDNINYAYFIRNTDLKSNVFEKYVDEHSYNFLSKTKLFGNEVIISNVGDVGSVFLCPTLSKPMTLGNNIIMIKSENITNYNYFMYILFKYSYGQDLIKSITGGSAQPKFNKTDLKSLKITLPTDNILNEFNIIIEKVFKKRNYNLQEVETLAKLKDSLLPKLMSGEIRVPCEEAV